MPSPVRIAFLDELRKRFGVPRKLNDSQSLFEIADGKARLYFRYSKRHPGDRTFFGLRRIDLQLLAGHNSLLCFTWEGQTAPLFVPFEEFEEVFAGLTPASDGQYKAQVYEQVGGTELYIANAGRFNVEGYLGWPYLESRIGTMDTVFPELSHAQVQTLLGGIGDAKGFDIWVPVNDRGKLDWSLTTPFEISYSLPPALEPIKEIAEEIDVIWLKRGGDRPEPFTKWNTLRRFTAVCCGSMMFTSRLAADKSVSASFQTTSGERFSYAR